jgi:hypothetical protein
MKINKAPEKIYLQDSMSTDTIGDLWPEWFDAKVSNNSIEYTRTDAFIEKAEKYFTEKFIKDVSVLAGGPVHINFDVAFSNFIKYMKGE